MTTVTGVFGTQLEAETALNQLLNAGFSRSDLSLIVSEKARDSYSAGLVKAEKQLNEVTGDTLTGVAVGGLLGALVAGLTTVGNLVLPGVGLLVAGPLVAVLAGAGAGATVGGLSGALIGAGFAEAEATYYENEIKQGKAVIVVHTETSDQATTAKNAMQLSGAQTKVA